MGTDPVCEGITVLSERLVCGRAEHLEHNALVGQHIALVPRAAPGAWHRTGEVPTMPLAPELRGDAFHAADDGVCPLHVVAQLLLFGPAWWRSLDDV